MRVGLDANALDSAGGGRQAEVERFLALVAEGRIEPFVPHTVGDEVEREGTPAAVRQVFSRPAPAPRRAPSAAQHIARLRVRAILRGDAQNDRHAADAAHLSAAAEAGCAFFVTHDKRILRRRPDLAATLPGLGIGPLARLLSLVDGG